MDYSILKTKFDITVEDVLDGEAYLVGPYIDDQVKFGSFLLQNEINFRHVAEDGIIMDLEDLERTIEMLELW